MTLRRTASGLKSLHLFYDADKLVFCEGGLSISYDDVLNGQGDAETCDTHFWAAVIGNFVDIGRVHFKSVGSKTVLRQIAEDVMLNDMGSIVVCLDRDYDDLNGTAIIHKNVLYTFGYSWENDVISLEFLHDFFFTHRNRNPANEINFHLLEETYNTFLRDCQKYCEFELHFVSRGIGYFFDREKPLRFVTLATGRPPVLSMEACRKALSTFGYKRGPRVATKLRPSDVGRVVYGKLLSRYAFQLLKHFLGAPPQKGDVPLRAANGKCHSTSWKLDDEEALSQSSATLPVHGSASLFVEMGGHLSLQRPEVGD